MYKYANTVTIGFCNLGYSGRAVYSDLKSLDRGQSLYPMGTVYVKLDQPSLLVKNRILDTLCSSTSNLTTCKVCKMCTKIFHWVSYGFRILSRHENNAQAILMDISLDASQTSTNCLSIYLMLFIKIGFLFGKESFLSLYSSDCINGTKS